MKYIIMAAVVLLAMPMGSARADCIDRTLSISFCVDDAAANQVIAREFDKGTLDDPFEGDISGIPYSFRLLAPKIRFTTGLATLNSTLRITVGPLTTEVDFNPSVNVDYSTSLGEIKGFLEAVPTVINNLDLSALNLNPLVEAALKGLIIGAYEDLELTIYPDIILDEVNSLVPANFDLEVQDIGVSIAARNGFLEVTLSVDVNACEPELTVTFYEKKVNGLWKTHLEVSTNIDITIDNVKLWDYGGREVINYNTPLYPTPGGNPNIYIVGGDYATTFYVARVRFRNGINIYVREWSGVL